MKKISFFATLLALTVFAVSLSAAETAKISLPDGLYLYRSSTALREDGSMEVGFERFFIVHNKTIYTSQQAITKFGISELNRQFTDKKTFKVLFGGAVIGVLRNLKIFLDDQGDPGFDYGDAPIIKKIKEGPAYQLNKYLSLLGSVARPVAVPEEYKAERTISFETISREEIDKTEMLVQNQLLPLVKGKKLVTYKTKESKPYGGEGLLCLDKMSDNNDMTYIGIYGYIFETVEDSYGVSVAFSTKNSQFHVIATDPDDAMPYSNIMTICGMLDVDGCGREELIIEKEFPDEDQSITSFEIYKQQSDGNWTLLTKIKTRRVL